MHVSVIERKFALHWQFLFVLREVAHRGGQDVVVLRGASIQVMEAACAAKRMQVVYGGGPLGEALIQRAVVDHVLLLLLEICELDQLADGVIGVGPPLLDDLALLVLRLRVPQADLPGLEHAHDFGREVVLDADEFAQLVHTATGLHQAGYLA